MNTYTSPATGTPAAGNRVLQLHPDDNLLVALTDLAEGETIRYGNCELVLPEKIGLKHKFAVTALAPGDPVRLYGVLVGRATQAIPAGGAITTENVHNATTPPQLLGRRPQWTPPNVDRWAKATFNGYHRSDGSVGTANYWIVVPLVFCENRNLELMKEAFLQELGYAPPQPYAGLVRALKQQYLNPAATFDAESLPGPETAPSRLFPNVDGLKFLTHDGGCGCNRQDSDTLCGLLAGYITHPNVAGATVLSLGCQHAQFELLQKEIQRRSPGFDRPVYFFEQQKLGSRHRMLSEAIQATFAGMAEANKQQRAPAPLSKLCIGLECGGSDGFSGISANPVLGQVSDWLAALGGSVILSEFPELYGVEQDLVDRCVSDEVAERFIRLMHDYNARAHAVGSGFDMNPSPGNIRDGLITDAIKSAGAAKKGGTSPVTDVLDYPEKVTKPGLNLLCTPGNDVESTTAEVASGANIVLFTTGLGTPTGNPVAPVVKVATNSALYHHMSDIMDLDTGAVITGEASIEDVAAEAMTYLIKVASGELQPKAVQKDQDDFIPWRRGVSL